MAGHQREPRTGGGTRVRPPLLYFAACLIALAPSPAPAAEARIVVAGPATGPRAAETEAMLAAVRKEAEAINAKGGVLGQQLSVSLADDGCDSAIASEAARKIAAALPALVIGHVCSNAAIAAAREYGAARILFVTPGARHRDVTERRAGPAIFRLAGRDDQQGSVTGAWLRERFAGKRIALVSDRTAYGRRLVEEARTALGPVAAPLVAGLVAGDKDFTPLVNQLKAFGAEAVYFAGYAIEAAILLRQMRAAGSAAAFIASDAVATDEFASLAGDKLDGVAIVRAADAQTGGGEAREPGNVTRARAALQLWRQSAIAAGMLTAEPVAAQMAKGAHETAALGSVSFTAKGDLDRPSYTVVGCSGAGETLAKSCTEKR